MNSPEPELIATLRAAFGPQPRRFAVAVSGGGDSVALLHLCTRAFGPTTFHAVTVDHGLREGSAQEAAMVAELARKAGVRHHVLRWRGWDGQGNLQDAARRARYGLMRDWARGQGIATLATAHTADDQAETLLMRLARESGVDGLSAMARRRDLGGITLLRPLLGVTRATLRAVLRDSGLPWAEDPGNEDATFARVRARRVLADLAPLGITAPGLARVAAQMREAREALELQTEAAARRIATLDGGDILLQRAGFHALPAEIARRLMAGAIRWVGDATHPPRRAPLLALVHSPEGTLGGCRILPDGADIRITREHGAVRDLRSPVSDLWDGRWRLRGPAGPGLVVGALGPGGLAQIADWRGSGRPRAALLAGPAVWRGGTLVAAPLAEPGRDWQAERIGGLAGFFASLLSH